MNTNKEKFESIKQVIMLYLKRTHELIMQDINEKFAKNIVSNDKYVTDAINVGDKICTPLINLIYDYQDDTITADTADILYKQIINVHKKIMELNGQKKIDFLQFANKSFSDTNIDEIEFFLN